MKVLIVPDVHLKPDMFSRASELLRKGVAERAVCLMDIADDWNQEWNIDLYIRTYDAAIQFAKDHPDTLWCYGNHDLSYVWNLLESGFSIYALETVCMKLRHLQEAIGKEDQIGYVQRIDQVIFSHGGVTEAFVNAHFPKDERDDANLVLARINQMGPDIMWDDNSPLWLRPTHFEPMYQADTMLQVIGHTPTERILNENGVVWCDVFSTTSDGQPIGTQEFPIVDTRELTTTGIK